MTLGRRLRPSIIRDDRGVSAVEFAMISPAFFALTLGMVNLSLMMFTQSNLHYATQSAARCASVQTTVCTDSTAIRARAAADYHGPDLGPVFTYAATACGNQVSGSVTYVLNAVFYQFTVPLSATACFP
jgi:Flp pilus assembly protein TadG